MTQVAIPPTSVSNETAAPGAVRGVRVRLNTFQALMRRWSRLHPYNAGQVMQVSGAGDAERWKAAIEAVIGPLGLGVPEFGVGDFEVRFAPLGEVTVEQPPPSAPPADFAGFVNEELNRPFAVGDLPIRFAILPRTDGTHYLAAFYDHWIGDSRAMRELMQRIFLQYQNPEGGAGSLPALSLAAPEFKRIFKRHMGWLPRSAAIRESIRNVWRHRHAFRINLADVLDFKARFAYRALPAGLIERVHKFAKAHGASVNDVFVAVLGQTMGVYTAKGRGTRKTKRFHFERQNVGIGTIVDIREASSEPLDNVFGLYLSSYTVSLDYPELSTVAKLLQGITRYTRRVKKTHATVRGYAALAMARFWWDYYDEKRFQAQFFHKSVPMAAGISNVNMSKSWADQKFERSDEMPQILDYLRISPTGPLLPMVFTLTTIGERLSLCVTYRATAIREGEVGKLVEDFVRRLEEVGS